VGKPRVNFVDFLSEDWLFMKKPVLAKITSFEVFVRFITVESADLFKTIATSSSSAHFTDLLLIDQCIEKADLSQMMILDSSLSFQSF
jgi:hypothetical protein